MTGPAFLHQPSRIHEPVPHPRSIRCRPFAQVAGTEGWRMGLLHDRPDDVLLWITRGQGRIIVDGVRRGLGVNNAVFLPAGTLMSVELGPQSFAQVIESPPGLAAGMPEAPLHLRPRDSMAQAELTAEIEAMQREISRGRAMVQDALAAHLTLVAVWLGRQKTDGTVDAPRDDASEALAKRYAQLLVAHHRSESVVADYADMLGVTPTQLSEATRAACGRSAADMLTERALHAAREMLADPEPPVEEVADALGFSSTDYFSRFVQAHTGTSPAGLRERVGETAPQAAPLLGRRA